MTPEKTYELVITLSRQQLKPEVTSWLCRNGFDEFVEGSIDDLDIDFDYDQGTDHIYDELGGEATPLIIYKYDRRVLEDLAASLAEKFPKDLNTTINAIETSAWQEGWKESFRPFETEKFVVFPPWEKHHVVKAPKIPLEIEPGMAFGTGQHATTKLCLSQLETLFAAGKKPFDQPDRIQLVDVGTGTGILAIAAMGLGVKHVEGNDIDGDAVLAAEANAKRNGVKPYLYHASDFQPSPSRYDLVIANILTVVLKRIFPKLDDFCRPGGLLLLSGILEEEVPEMLQLAATHEMTLKSRDTEDGWACLLLQKHGLDQFNNHKQAKPPVGSGGRE